MLKVVRYFFPTFEFSWLGEEMEQKWVLAVPAGATLPGNPS